MSAELIVGQEKMYITPSSILKWAVGMAVSLAVPYVFNTLANIWFWNAEIVASSIDSVENVYSRITWDLYYIGIGVLFCVIRYRKTITFKPNISKRTYKYIITLVINTFLLGFLCLFCIVFLNDNITSDIENIARVRRYTYEHLYFIYALLPSMGAYNLIKTWLAYQATRFLFDKSIRTN